MCLFTARVNKVRLKTQAYGPEKRVESSDSKIVNRLVVQWIFGDLLIISYSYLFRYLIDPQRPYAYSVSSAPFE